MRRYPLDTLKDPKVILDYSGYLAENPGAKEELGDVLIIPYNPGKSRPTYSMCDTVAMVASPGDDLDVLYRQAKSAAPLCGQAIFYGRGGDPSREGACAVCVDRNIRFRQKHLC